jgi:dUTP pyrophosphatase
MEEKSVRSFINQGKDVVFILNNGEQIQFKDFFEIIDTFKKRQLTIDYTKKHEKAYVQVYSKLGRDYVPQYATSLSSGCDLKAAIDLDITLPPGKRILVPTGLKVNIPPGFELQVRPKSGLALKEGITVLNSPGTVDADYSQWIGVILINHGETDFKITPGMKIAQAVLCPVYQMQFQEVTEEYIDTTDKKSERIGGFGSTGL